LAHLPATACPPHTNCVLTRVRHTRQNSIPKHNATHTIGTARIAPPLSGLLNMVRRCNTSLLHPKCQYTRTRGCHFKLPQQALPALSAMARQTQKEISYASEQTWEYPCLVPSHNLQAKFCSHNLFGMCLVFLLKFGLPHFIACMVYLSDSTFLPSLSHFCD
jgi:hypothetical protein